VLREEETVSWEKSEARTLRERMALVGKKCYEFVVRQIEEEAGGQIERRSKDGSQ